MAKRLLALLCTSVLVFQVSALAFAEEDAAKGKAARWDGMVAMTSPDKSTITVRQAGSNIAKTVAYDSSTQWESQEHGSKKVNKIDASQVKDHDRVICTGTWEKDGVLHATLISKRLTN